MELLTRHARKHTISGPAQQISARSLLWGRGEGEGGGSNRTKDHQAVTGSVCALTTGKRWREVREGRWMGGPEGG